MAVVDPKLVRLSQGRRTDAADYNRLRAQVAQLAENMDRLTARMDELCAEMLRYQDNDRVDALARRIVDLERKPKKAK